MTVPAAADLRVAARAAQELLAGVPDVSAQVPALGRDVRQVVLHIAGCLQWYAHDLVAGGTGSPGPVPSWPEDIASTDLLRELGISAEVLARVLTLAGPGDRAWHPWGVADAAGIAAIAIAEIVLHTDDVATALALPWVPPVGPVGATLARLFPDTPADADPWAALRWASGRGDLPGRERVAEWRYAMAPR